MKNNIIVIGLLLIALHSITCSAQEIKSDSTVVFMASNSFSDSLNTDSTKIVEDAALDIGQNRGLFIVTPDQKMQLRILGSVRYLLVYDDIELYSKNSLNTYQIPVGDANKRLPNYYNGLTQSRLGFEVTRHTKGGNVFVRLETDFAGQFGFRIRHAYGQYNKLLVGQTWSLFSQITALPAIVGFGGPIGSVSVRTPQIRVTFQGLVPSTTVSAGLEYSTPDIVIPDSLSVKTFQLLPDITGRILRNTKWGSVQISGIMPMLSGRTDSGKLIVRPGWGISASTVVNSWAKGKWYFQAAGGQAISRFFADLSGQGLDLLIDTTTQTAHLPIAYGGFATYEHHWTEKIFSNITYGTLFLQKEDFSPDDTYHRGNNVRFNTFWTIVEGARVGCEYVHAFRKDKGGEKGTANRINVLFYYDF